MAVMIVTGASSGIGREFALQLSRKYSRMNEIWLIARRKELLLELEKEIKIPVRIFAMDLTRDEDMQEFSAYLESEKPDIKLLVNCAGYGKIGRFDELDLKEQCGMIDLNCTALTAMTGMCLPYISEHSRIINVASAAAFSPQPDFAVYAATKAYVLNFSRALNAELKQRKITVTAVCPGPVDTDFFTIAGEKSNAVFKKQSRADASRVVEKAIKDAALGDDVSIYGAVMKMAKTATKVLPQKLIINMFNK